MQSLYRRSWFPGIGAKPLESIRIGCEPSPAQSRLFFCKLFHLCARTRPRVCSLKLGTNKPPKVKTNSYQISQFMSRYRRSTSQYRRSTSQHDPAWAFHELSSGCPRLPVLSTCHLLSCWNSLNVSDILTQTPERMLVSKKIVDRFFSAGHLWTIQRGLSISYYYSLGQYPGISWYNP